ncbi:MAG: cyclase family protein [Synergistaceae bacterium]|jgi:kynurenine formamidase|nr:cyclase family protein [Synergistaceae bacterium]
MSRIIDLTYPLDPDMLVWPGNRRPVYEWLECTNTAPANVTYMSMCAHTGTHVDSPLHFCDGGETVDRMSLDHFWGRAKMFEVDPCMEGGEIPRSAVEEANFTLDGAKIFVLRTRVERYANVRQYNLEYAYPSVDLLGWLMSEGVICYMTDATSIDPWGDAESPRHRCFLRGGHAIVENLKNLAKLPKDRTFTICAMPLALPGREGSPCRAAAWLDD